MDADPLYNALVRARPGEHGFGPEELVASLLRRPEWHQDAACRGAGVDVFFPARGASLDEARALCDACPVAGPCAEAGSDEPAGVWAGRSPMERRPTAQVGR